jgi:alkanesulfonate monooxygenase SsuD/methylene tetrahydromethanopterin reductase-like flavin-dependent oxidoreductase (luciferase family)
MRPRVSCSLFIPQTGFDYETLRARAMLAESLGFTGLWTVDHMWARGAVDAPFLDGWTLISALAEATSNLRLGVLVTCNSYRNPGILAKSVSTADHISKGRIELGIGAGWMEEEFLAYGFPFPPVHTRLSQLEESLEVITRLFSQRRTSLLGEHYRFQDAPFEPKPLNAHPYHHGSGPNVLMRLARYAHRWNCPMPGGTPRAPPRCSRDDRRDARNRRQRAGRVVEGRRRPRQTGRDRRRTIGSFVDLDSMAICGTPNAVVDRLCARMAKGVGDFAVLFGDLGAPGSLELFADRVAPHLMAQ